MCRAIRCAIGEVNGKTALTATLGCRSTSWSARLHHEAHCYQVLECGTFPGSRGDVFARAPFSVVTHKVLSPKKDCAPMIIRRVSTWRSLCLAGALAWPVITSATAQSGIGFAQVNAATPQTPQAVVAATYTSAQTAGNFNVVAVGWNDTVAQVVSVTDSGGNPYVRAVGPTIRSGRSWSSAYSHERLPATGETRNGRQSPAHGRSRVVLFSRRP